MEFTNSNDMNLLSTMAVVALCIGVNLPCILVVLSAILLLCVSYRWFTDLIRGREQHVI
jgi:hypothetical protein